MLFGFQDESGLVSCKGDCPTNHLVLIDVVRSEGVFSALYLARYSDLCGYEERRRKRRKGEDEKRKEGLFLCHTEN